MRNRLVPVALAAGALPLVCDLRVAISTRPASPAWERVPVEPRRAIRLGFSLRTPQAESLGLDPNEIVAKLLAYPFEVVRLGAYWDRIETRPGRYDFSRLDAQVDAVTSAGRQIILGLGAVKNFGYPECFVPGHVAPSGLPEGCLIDPYGHGALARGATEFVVRVVERYRSNAAVVAWQVEHEAVDPLGLEHSWRLAESFVAAEVAAVRRADPDRPVILTGFLPTSTPVRAQQWWRTRDEGDSLAVARRLGDVVGIDFYPRHGLIRLGNRTVYLCGARTPWQVRSTRRLLRRAGADGRQVMVTEGQAEPWETVTEPPNPGGRHMYSCAPMQVIDNFNQAMRWSEATSIPLSGYLFWGVEYWMTRLASGDGSYLKAAVRVLEESA